VGRMRARSALPTSAEDASSADFGMPRGGRQGGMRLSLALMGALLATSALSVRSSSPSSRIPSPAAVPRQQGA